MIQIFLNYLRRKNATTMTMKLYFPINEQSDTVESNGGDFTDEGDNLPLSTIAGDKKHIYRW